MGRRTFHAEPDGLNYNERLARLEGTVLGTPHHPGLDADHDATRQRLEVLESIERRRAMPWYLRLWFRKKEHM